MKLAKLLESVSSLDKKIIVTAPHAMIQIHEEHEKNTHPFDFRAKEAAEALAAVLKKDFHVDLFLSEVPRSIIDLNRVPARPYKWRQDILDKINQYTDAGNQVILFDVHSFGNKDRDAWIDNALVLLDGESDVDNLFAEIKEIKGNIKRIEIKERDDIVQTAKKAGATALLLEFNEDTEILSRDELLAICDKAAQFAKELDNDD